MPTTYMNSLSVTPWCDPITFASRQGISLEDAYQYVTDASWLLYALLDGQFTAGDTYVDEYAVLGCKLRLRHQPVAEVETVEELDSCGENPISVDWCMLDSSLISVCAGGGNTGLGLMYDYQRNFGMSPCGGRGASTRYRVRYRQGDNLPPGAGNMACFLAEEALKARNRLPGCLLPDRIQTITRQGVSWTIFDPQDFLENGGVGISTIDLWLSAARRLIGGVVRDPTEGLILSSQLMSTRVGPAFDDIVRFSWVEGDLVSKALIVRGGVAIGWLGSYTAQLRDGPDHTDDLVGTFTVTSEAQGLDVLLRFNLTQLESGAIPAGIYWWDAQQGSVTRLRGTATVLHQITVP